jgi:uncharacterized membrane protein
MYYNFHIFLIILAIISPVAAYNRNKILKKISIQHEVIFTSIFILIIFGLIQLYNKNKLIPDLKNNTIGYLIFNGTLTCITLYLGGLILMKENVFKYKTLQKSVYLILLIIIAVCIYQQKLTIKTVLGLVLIMIGSYLIDINV